MIFRDFPLYFMEALKCWRSLHGCIGVFMFLTTVSKGSACEAPSSPQCFRRTSDESIYICEWSMNTTESNVIFELYIGDENFRSERNRCELREENLIRLRRVDIFVEAHLGNSTCRSTIRSVVLVNTVKYEAPQNISTSWLKDKLRLSWRAPERHPAEAEVRFQREGHQTWGNILRTNATKGIYTYMVNLLKNSSHQIQIRHKSTQATNPLWSDWSLVIVPAAAELEEKPNVTVNLVNGSRRVVLKWKPMNHAAAVNGVVYRLQNSQSSHGCPCSEKEAKITGNKYTTHVSYSAVNISLIAINSAGSSPPAIVQLPANPAAELEICDKTLLDTKLKKKTCLEFYELQGRDSRPETVITLPGRKTKKERLRIKEKIKDYVRYLYFEHTCADGKPQTVKMCLFYQKEGVPGEPQNFTAFAETQSSVNLSWEKISVVDQRGFFTHYSLCSMRINPQDENEKCYNVSASMTKYRLENLTSGAKYNITLAGVTGAGEGLKAGVTINTLPEKPVNVWWSLGLLLVFFLFPTLCTFMLKRIKNKIFPPVPKPVIEVFTSCPAEAQEMLEGKEEVHDLTLHQLHPEGKTITEDSETKSLWGGEWDEGTDKDEENERESGGSDDESLSPGSTDRALKSSRESETTDLAQVDSEIAMVIYRNDLVFDVKTDLT